MGFVVLVWAGVQFWLFVCSWWFVVYGSCCGFGVV